MESRCVGLTVEVPLQPRHRDPPSGSNLECRREAARTTKAVEGVGVQPNTAGDFRDGNQIGHGRLVVMAERDGHYNTLTGAAMRQPR
jgi:hypothetical protein